MVPVGILDKNSGTTPYALQYAVGLGPTTV
jgi:hypothetical protein